jgi:hypothetical protein
MVDKPVAFRSAYRITIEMHCNEVRQIEVACFCFGITVTAWLKEEWKCS